MMASSRFFLANLPSGTTEDDLKEIFQDYGEVTKVEIKTKENLIEPDNFTTIGFVTLAINGYDVQNCLNELQWREVKGAYLKVSIAKESFLERLKREREAVGEKTKTETTPVSDNLKKFTPAEGVNTHKKFSDDLELDEDDDDLLLISKKRAVNSLRNGKIVIQGTDAQPVHIINKTKIGVRTLDTRTADADRKRKKALDQKKKQYNQNKIVIQKDLANENRKAQKIKFDDPDLDTDGLSQIKSEEKTNIFGTDSEDNDNDESISLKLKPEYFGKKGEKLLEMQCKQSSGDPRFKLDAKFIDDEDDEEDKDNDIELEQKEETNERDWQIGILEQVVNTKVEMPTNFKNKSMKTMLRFDPSKDDHSKFLRQKNEKQTNKKEGRKKDIKENGVPVVSKKIFYEIGENFSESLKTRGDGFSLLKMFGVSESSDADNVKNDSSSVQLEEKILLNKFDRNAFNAFSYDSSSCDEREDEIKDESLPATSTLVQATRNKSKISSKNKQKCQSLVESFFISKSDARLKEGAKFFKYEKQAETNEAYEEKRKRLKMLIRSKISKTKKLLICDKRKNKLALKI